MLVAMGISSLILAGAATFVSMAATSMSGTVSQTHLSARTGNASEFIFSRVRFASAIDNGGDATGRTLRLLIQDSPPVDVDGKLIAPADVEDDHDHHRHYNDENHGYRYDNGRRVGYTDENNGWHDGSNWDDDNHDNRHHGHSDEHGRWHEDDEANPPPAVVVADDGGAYHYEVFQLQSFSTTNGAAILADNRLVYTPSENLPDTITLISSGARMLPNKPAFAITNVATALVNFAVVDSFSRDFYQTTDIQGAVVARNRSSSTNIVAAIP